MFKVAHGGVHVAHAHAHRGQARLHTDIVGRHRLGLLERGDRLGPTAGGGIGAAQQIVGFGIRLARFSHFRQRFHNLVRAALGELNAGQNLVGGQIVRRPAKVFPRRLFGLLQLAKLFLDHGLQIERALNAADIGRDPFQVRVGGLVVAGLRFHDRLQVDRLDVARRTLQHGIDIRFGRIILAGRELQARAVQPCLHDAGLIGDELVQHGNRAGHIVLQPQQLRLGQQRFLRFGLGGDRPIDLLLRTRQIGSGNRKPSIGEQRLHGVGCDLFGFAEGFLCILRALQANLGVTACHQDRSIQQRVLALGLQRTQQLIEFVLGQQRLR